MSYIKYVFKGLEAVPLFNQTQQTIRAVGSYYTRRGSYCIDFGEGLRQRSVQLFNLALSFHVVKSCNALRDVTLYQVYIGDIGHELEATICDE